MKHIQKDTVPNQTSLYSIEVIIDRATQQSAPCDDRLQKWASHVIASYRKTTELTIRLVDEAESAQLNQQYRQKTGPTNILSFSFEAPLGVTSNILGDIILCPTVIDKENRDILSKHDEHEAHWAHLVIHGCLHLLDYHHDDEIAACQMEQQEIEHLAELGYPNPYN